MRVVIPSSRRLVRKGGRPWCRFFAYLHFFAGWPTVRFDLTLHNPRRARHPGNFWSLGDKGSIYIRDAALTLALPQDTEPPRIQFSPELSTPFRTCDPPLELYQDSSGGENWRGTVHVNRHHVVPNTFRGYRLRTPDREEAGLRATPIVTLEGGGRWLGMAMEYFWQNFPKAIEATPDSLTLRLFPKQYADVHELQGGEQKTHTFWVSFAPDQRDGRAAVVVPGAAASPRDPILVLFDRCRRSPDSEIRRPAYPLSSARRCRDRGWTTHSSTSGR